MLQAKITEDMKQAMRSGDKTRLSVLRMIRSHIKNRQIQDGKEQLTDDTVLGIIHKMAKQHTESIENFQKGGRADLVDKEAEELEVLEELLPEKITDEKLEQKIDQAIDETGAVSMKDMGKVMKFIMPRVKARADGRKVNEIVRTKLS